MHKKWGTMIKQQKSLQKKLKTNKGVAEFFADLPEKNYMRDNISKKHVKLSECKSSTLRRYVKLLNSYFKNVSKSEERLILQQKLDEIHKELDPRPDADINNKE